MDYDKVIFVCTGNTCRSPMAEFIMKQHYKGSKYIEIISRGVAVHWPEPINPFSADALENNGILYEPRVSAALTKDDIRAKTLILTMTMGHKRSVMELCSQPEADIYTIKEFAGESGDVKDPYGQPARIYDLCFLELERLIMKINNRLIHEDER